MIKWGRRLVFALQVMTRFPISMQLRVKEDDFPRMAMFFPVVGLCVGLFCFIVALAAYWTTNSDLFSACVAVLCSVCITGAYHLDGWSDTFDAFGEGKNREKILAKMKDSRIGVRGGGALVVDIVIKITLTFLILSTSIQSDAGATSSAYTFLNMLKIDVLQKPWPVLIAANVLSRTAIAAGGAVSKSARKDGSGRMFIEQMNGWDLLRAAVLCALITYVLLGWFYALVLTATTLIAGIIVASGVSAQLKGITGDTLGAINESAEMICLFVAYMMQMAL